MRQEQRAKRVFLMDWDNTRPAFIMAAEELKKRGYEILYWVVPDIKAAETIKDQFKETFFHWHDDAINIKPCPEIDINKFIPPGEDLISNFFEVESIISGMKKFYNLSPSALKKKGIFHDLIHYWYGVVDKLKPDIIFFVNVPHSVYDYTVFYIAKLLKIKTFMFAYSGVGDRYLTIEDYRIGSRELQSEYRANINGRFELKDLSLEIREFYLWHQNHKIGEVQPDLRAFQKKASGLNKLKLKIKLILKNILQPSFFSKMVSFIKKEIGPNMKKEYQALQVPPDFKQKYIYLALAYQPESSTSPLGGIFVDQILIVKILSYYLPAGWQIYVKEHPTQWTSTNLAFFNFRFKGYYEEIARIKNVKMVPVETNSHELIANAQAVSTVTGTSGMEALLRLRPVLLFGNMWYYQDCFGVFKIKNAAACQEAIQQIKEGLIINQRQIINFLYSLDKASYHFNYERCAADRSSLSEEEAGKNIIKHMIDYAEAAALND